MMDMIALAMAFAIVAFGVAFYALTYAMKKIKKLQKEIDRLHQIEVKRARMAYDRLQVPVPLDSGSTIVGNALDEVIDYRSATRERDRA